MSWIFVFSILYGFHFTVMFQKYVVEAGALLLVMCLSPKVLYHVGSGSGNEHGRSARWACRNWQNRNYQRYGTMSWEVCCGFQLFRPDGFPRAWTDF